jgi:hypothetical protein
MAVVADPTQVDAFPSSPAMSSAEEGASSVYAAHVAKINALKAKRVKPYDEAAVRAVENLAGIVDILTTSEMEIPEEIESRMWLTLAGEIMEAQGQGVELNGEKWNLLDILLACAEASDEFPVLLLIEVMLASEEVVVLLRGRPVHAGQLYNISYDGWSEMEDLKERARHHFKFGFLLITIGEVGRAADQLLLAQDCDSTTNAKDLLQKLLSASNNEITTETGKVVTLQDGNVVVSGGGAAPAAKRAAVESSAEPTKLTSTASAKRTVIPTEEEQGWSTTAVVGGVVAIAAVITLAAVALQFARRK